MAAPRLLDKKIVNIELATQRKEQIDAGLALARKVDVLRETKAEEEAQLETFRRETIKRVQMEIDTKIRERDVLGRENAIFQERMRTQEEEYVVRARKLEEREKYVEERFKLLESIINEIE